MGRGVSRRPKQGVARQSRAQLMGSGSGACPVSRFDCCDLRDERDRVRRGDAMTVSGSALCCRAGALGFLSGVAWGLRAQPSSSRGFALLRDQDAGSRSTWHETPGRV